MSQEYVLNMSNIDKTFPGVHALKNVNFQVKAGEVHVLMGENGAGKSTLMKILGGIYAAEAGDIFISGEKVKIDTVQDSRNLGVSIIHQELVLAKNMTIAENMYLGREPRKGPLKFVDFDKMNKDAQAILNSLNLDLKAKTIVSRLSIAQQQMVEIAGALSTSAKILVMDEPTASLSEKEVLSLFDSINDLKKKGVGIIYISHRLPETFTIGDRVTVMRDGEYIGTKIVKETTSEELIRMMVGREVTDVYGVEKVVGKGTLLEVKNLSNRYVKNINFTLKKGEILGFSGLVGAGRTELVKAIFGIDPIDTGEVYLNEKKLSIKCPNDAIKNGISLVPEDRKGAGLVLIQSIGMNITLAVLDKFINFIKVNKKQETEIIETYRNKLSIKSTGPNQHAITLSGGNQQKVVVSKWLATEPKILILDEPTRGIDVGAKAEIYHLMNDLAKEGISIIMVSSELPEILNMSSRVAVMHEGKIAKILDSTEEELTQEKLMFYATGGQ